MATKIQFSLRDAYLAVYDAQVAQRRFTLADLAILADADVPTLAASVAILADNSLIEVEPAGTPSATSVLQCSDATRLARKDAFDKYMTLERDLRAQRAPSAGTPTAERTTAPSTPRPTAAPSDAAQHAAQRVITLSERSIGKGRLLRVTSARPAMWETAAIMEHRNEHKHAARCVICDGDYAHTTTVAISSRCYNHMRVAVREVLHSTDTAVIRWLRGASEAQLAECIDRCRERMGIVVATLTAKAAAKLMAQSLADSE